MGFAYFMQQFERRRKWDFFGLFYNTVPLFLGFPSAIRPQNNAHRVVFASILLSTIIYVTIENTYVIKLFTSPIFHRQVKTIDEILEQKFNLAGSEFALQKLMQQNEVRST